MLLAFALLFAPLQEIPIAAPITHTGVRPAIAATIAGIASFTRWPQPQAPVRLCLAGVTQVSERDFAGVAIDGQPVAATRVDRPAALATARCAILYLGRMPVPAAQRLIWASYGRAILTIAEDDPECRGGAMFCLRDEPAAVRFLLNLDAISRGAVKVDPRVLRLTRGAH